MTGRDVSVIVCTRDRPRLLAECLNSIAAGTCLPLEVIIVDQSRTDETRRIAERMRIVAPFAVRYLRSSTTGITSARNAGIREASGQVVLFTDDDCRVSQDWVRAIADEFRDPSVACVCGHTMPANHADRPRQTLISTLNHQGRRRVIGRHNPIAIGRGNNMAFRKESLERLGGFNERIGVGTKMCAGDDIDVFYRLLVVGETIVHSPEAVVYHSQPDDLESVMRKKREYAISVSALMCSRLRRGDLYAGCLLTGKLLYEICFLLTGGLLRGNLSVARVGWHSIVGTVSGMRYFFNTLPVDPPALTTLPDAIPLDNEPCAHPK